MNTHIFGTKSHFERIRAHMVMQGVSKVCVDFDGSDDSGSVKDVYLTFTDGSYCGSRAEELLKVKFPGVIYRSVFDNVSGRWKEERRETLLSLEEILKNATYAALEEAGHDWYNNDGGYGQLILELGGNGAELLLEVHIREVSTTDYAYEFASGEMVPADLPEGG